MTYAILFIGILVFLSHLFSFLFQKTKVPDVLPLIIIGLIAGPITQFVSPSMFGELGPVFSVLALILILFHGGVGLSVETLRNSMSSGTRLSVIGFGICAGAIGITALAAMDFSLLEALLLGSILGGTSSAVVIPMMGKLNVGEDTKAALLLESTFTDVLCIVFAIGFIKAIQFHNLNPGLMTGQIIASFLLAAGIGYLGAAGWSIVLGKVRGLENNTFTTPAFVFIVYGITEALGYSGGIAVFVCGVTLGNIDQLKPPFIKQALYAEPVRLNDTEQLFLGEMVFLLKTFFFLYIGLSIPLNNWETLLAGLVISAVVFLVRILAVRFSIPPHAGLTDAVAAFAMTPKGLASAVLAAYCVEAGIPHAALMQGTVYATILFTIAISALLVFLNERQMLNGIAVKLFPQHRTTQ